VRMYNMRWMGDDIETMWMHPKLKVERRSKELITKGTRRKWHEAWCGTACGT